MTLYFSNLWKLGTVWFNFINSILYYVIDKYIPLSENIMLVYKIDNAMIHDLWATFESLYIFFDNHVTCIICFILEPENYTSS